MSLPPDMLELVERANNGDRQAAVELGPCLDRHPKVWRHVGDQSRQAQEQLLNFICGKEHLADQEATRRTMAVMRQELAGPESSPLEQMLIDRIVLCWLHVAFLEQATTACLQHAAEKTTTSIAQAEFGLKQIDAHQQWIDRAHRRYLAACKALAQVRRLGVPAIQVNVGEQQVNVASM